MDNFYKSFFYRGWRPLIGHIAALSVLVAFVINPLCIMAGIIEQTSIDTSAVIGLVTLVLGSIGLRGYEKIQGVKND